MRLFTLAATILTLALSASAADAKSTPCRDAKGKFAKCPPVAAAPAGPCRDKTTKKFAKCSAPNTEPVSKGK
jgi:hypothetical protein